jgi:hypothetical protein
VQQHCFRHIVGGVTRCYRDRTSPLRYFRQECVAYFPSCLFEGRNVTGSLVGQHIPFLYRRIQFQILSQCRNKTGIGVRLFAAEVMIQVSYVETQMVLVF